MFNTNYSIWHYFSCVNSAVNSRIQYFLHYFHRQHFFIILTIYFVFRCVVQELKLYFFLHLKNIMRSHAFTKTLTIASRWGGQCLNKYQRCIFLHTRFSFVMYHDFSGFLVTFHIQIIIIYIIDINIKPVYYETKKGKILK